MDHVIYGGITIKDILVVLGGGLGVSIVAQVIKRVFKLSSSKVIQFLVVATSFVATGLVDFIGALHNNPTLLGAHTIEVLGAANVAHTFVVSDADAFLGKVKVALNDENAKTTAAAKTPDLTPPANTPPAASF